jgi:hypothetical protein
METKILNNISNHFKLPIDFEKKVNLINDTIIHDLAFNLPESPYNVLFNKDNHSINNLLMDKWKKYFSNNKHFIISHQKLISYFNTKKYLDVFVDNDDSLLNQYIEHKNNDGFNEKYEFIAWKHLEFANKNQAILQGLTYYNLFSPIINLSIPIFLLIMPFIIIKFVMKTSITFDNYKNILLKQLKNHSLGKIFSLFSNEISTNKKIFAAISIAFYFFSLYQSTLTCVKFYKNSFKIQQYLYNVKNHLVSSINKVNALIDITSKITHFNLFRDYLMERKNKLVSLLTQFSFIQTNTFNYKNIVHFGQYLSLFYNLRNEQEYNDILYFSFNVQCYINNINSLCHFINQGKINKCKLTNDKNKQILKQQYYLYHNDKPIKNDIQLKNYIITGPNASGKTTLLKTTLLNIIFSQQFGFGFYKKATIYPYRILHSYINIPDTTGRDSLFQAEARRCLDILNDVKKCKKGHSFIIFDEIYSGTNPDEAIQSAKAFLKCLKQYNVIFLITTHFKELTQIKSIHNYHMDCYLKNNKIIYTYKFKKGISNIKGGFKVLEDLHYPEEIMNQLK